jgi:hypothetical protein
LLDKLKIDCISRVKGSVKAFYSGKRVKLNLLALTTLGMALLLQGGPKAEQLLR